MKRLRLWFSLRYQLRVWRGKARYWRKQARQAERQLEAERNRNREREDTLVAVPMRMSGLWGLEPRAKEAPVVARPRPAPMVARDPWELLSWADRNEYDMFWKSGAEAAGIPEQQAKQQFLQELAIRKQPLNDDPFN